MKMKHNYLAIKFESNMMIYTGIYYDDENTYICIHNHQSAASYVSPIAYCACLSENPVCKYGED